MSSVDLQRPTSNERTAPPPQRWPLPLTWIVVTCLGSYAVYLAILTTKYLSPLTSVALFVGLTALTWKLVTVLVRAAPRTSLRDEAAEDADSRWLEQVTWKPVHALTIFLLGAIIQAGILAIFLVPAGVLFLSGHLPREKVDLWLAPLEYTTFNETFTGVTWGVILFGLCVWFLRRQLPRGWPGAWINPATIGEDVREGFVAFVQAFFISIMAMAVYLAGVALCKALLPIDGPAVDATLQHLRDTENAERNSWGIAVAGFLLAPFSEEVFFRGVLYRSLRRRWSMEAATAVVALTFAAVHYRIYHFLPVFVFGMLACQLYERRRSLVAPIAMHGFWNLLVAVRFVWGVLRGNTP